MFVVGEPGVGKSRVATEAVATAAGTGMATVQGRVGTLGPALAYRPLAEALHSLARDGLMPPAGELGEYGPTLTRLLNDSHGPGSGLPSPLVVAEAVLRLAASVGRRRGFLLLLEDLHAADSGTLAVVEYLVDNIGQLPAVLLLTTDHAPGPARDLTARACRRGAATFLDVPVLDRSQVHRLLADELGVARSEVDYGLVHQVTMSSAGIPFVVKELARNLITRGTDARPPSVPTTVANDVRQRAEQLGPHGLRFLNAAALFGPRFPLAVLQHAFGGDDGELTTIVRTAVASRLILPEEPDDQWYVFRFPLMAQALLTDLVPAERADYADRTLRALHDLHPGLPGGWCAQAAALQQLAGNTAEAARLRCEAARRATAGGSTVHAVELLTRAHGLLGHGDAADVRAQVLEQLLDAVSLAARCGQAPRVTVDVDALDDHRLPGLRRAGLHARMAEIAALTGLQGKALRHLEIARRLLGCDPGDAYVALIDLAAAQTETLRKTHGRPDAHAEQARRAAERARRAGLPAVEGKALLLLGQSNWDRDEATAQSALLGACETAGDHGLPMLRAAAEVYLGMITLRRDGLVWRTELARREALSKGAAWPALEADAALAHEEIQRCEFEAAGARIRRGTADAARLRLDGALPALVLAEAVRQAHQGRRAEMEAALDRLGTLPGAVPGMRPYPGGFARAFCALLEERRDVAEEEFARAIADCATGTGVGDSGAAGVMLLLDVLAGQTGTRHGDRAAAAATGSRWDRWFVGLANAVLLGRRGSPSEAAAAAAVASEAAGPYPTAHRLGLRLVAPAAYEDGWGTPLDWLREAEEYFHGASLPVAAGACRSQLHAMGAPMRQRRPGVELIPQELRRRGVTVREFDVARLLIERLGNKDIAGRLYISARTVEKHVASLLRKTGHPDRMAFASAARALGLVHGS